MAYGYMSKMPTKSKWDEEEADGWDHVMRESANEKCNLSARWNEHTVFIVCEFYSFVLIKQ